MKDCCTEERHVFTETNYCLRAGKRIPCECKKLCLRLFAYQDIVREFNPLALYEFEVKPYDGEEYMILPIDVSRETS